MAPSARDTTGAAPWPAGLVARDDELDAICTLLDRPAGGVRALELEGEGTGPVVDWEYRIVTATRR